MTKQKKGKSSEKELTVKLPKEMPFDEVMTRLVKVKPPEKKDIKKSEKEGDA